MAGALGAFGGATVGSAVVELVGVDAGLTGALGKADAELHGFQASGSSALAGFGKAAAGVFAAITAAAIGFGAYSIKAYEEHQAALVKLESTFRNVPTLVGANVKAFEAQAVALSKLTGFTDTEILAADAALGRFNLTAAQLHSVIPLVLDYARATGVDATTAAGNIGRALLGNARALKFLGITFKATGDTAKDFATVQAGFQSRVGGLAVAYGQTLPGKIAIFQAQLHLAAESAGKELLPAVTSLVSGATNLIPLVGLLASNAVHLALAFAAFKGLTFLPALLTSVAGGLAKMPLIGNDILGTAAISAQEAALAATIPEVVALAAAGYTLVKMYTAGNIKITTYNQALRLAGEQLGQEATAAQIAAKAHEILNSKTRAAAGGITAADIATGKLIIQQEQAAQKTNKVADALVKEHLALTGLSGGFLGIKGAQLQAQAANLSYRQALQQLTRDQKANTDANKHNNVSALQLAQDQLAVKQAMLGRVTAQANLTSSIQDFADKELASGVSTGRVIDQVKKFAHEAGLTKKQTDNLISSVLGLAKKYGMLPPSVSTKVTAPGLDGISSQVHAFGNILDSLNGRTVNIYFKAHHLD
jgi:hypothetical protein